MLRKFAGGVLCFIVFTGAYASIRTGNITERNIVTGKGQAVSVWQMPDGSTLTAKITNSTYDNFRTGVIRQITPPRAGAIWKLAWDQKKFDTIDGELAFGDAYIFGDLLTVRIADGEDYAYESCGETGICNVLSSTGNFIRLESGDYTGILPLITMTKIIPGVTIVNGVLSVDDSVPKIDSRTEDRKFIVHHSIAFSSGSSATSGGVDESISYAHEVTGDDRALFVGVTWDVTAANASGDYNGDALTQRFNMGVSPFNAGLTLFDPDLGNNTISLTVGTSNSQRSSAVSITGVDHSSSVIRISTSAVGNGGVMRTAAPNVMPDDFLIDYARCGCTQINPLGGQVQRMVHDFGGNNWAGVSTEYASSVSSYTTEMSWRAGTMVAWKIGTVAFIPARREAFWGGFKR